MLARDHLQVEELTSIHKGRPEWRDELRIHLCQPQHGEEFNIIQFAKQKEMMEVLLCFAGGEAWSPLGLV